MKNGRCLKSWLAAAVVLGLAGSVWAQQMAPVNPAFARWQREQAAKDAASKEKPAEKPRAAKAASARGEAGGEDEDFGFVPTVLDMGYLSNLNDNLVQGVGETLESAYDLREAGALTEVRDQGSYGNCWAFAAMGSLESWVKKAEGVSLDLSENHLVNLHGWSQGFGAGGNAQMAEGYFLRWAGPVAESEDAYPRPGDSVAGTPVRHVQRVRWIPGKTAYLDNDGIKQALKAFGALQADYYHAGSYYNANKASYYFNPGTSFRLSNHAVDLVGWDDNYSRKNFNPQPPGNGAYIVRNSWGSGWGKSGYFYISYYDESFAWGPLYSFSGVEAADNYDGVYQHDPLGMVGAIGYSSPTAWGANVFTAESASKVAAVGFYAMTPRTAYNVYVYTGCRAGEPRSGTLAAQQGGTVDLAGYVTVPLEVPAAVSAGQRFSVVVQLTSPGYGCPLAVEYAVAGYSATASAKEGESFLSANGSKWDDFTKRVNSTANFCCKAYVKAAAASKTLSGIAIAGENSLKAGSSATFSCTATYSDGSSKAVSPRWSITSGSEWASVDSKGKVTAKATDAQRTVTLKATYSEGGKTATATWTFYVTTAAPAAPTGLSATAGTEESCVRLAWTASEGAASYAVYRGTKESASKAGYLGTVTVTRYADTAAVPGVDYRYFVKAKNGSGSSAFSEGAWGWRALAAPNGLAASDGAGETSVAVTWNRSEGAGCYRVWRAEGVEAEPMAISPWQTACRFDDTTGESGVVYTYYVTAALDADGTRESAFGIPDEGYRAGPATLKAVEISGPVSLVSGGRGTYAGTAVYTDGTRKAVAAEWSLAGGTLAVDGGKAIVTAPEASENTSMTLSASYTDGVTRTGRLTITVTPAVPSAPATLEVVSATERGIALRWSAVANAGSYQLWRSGTDGVESVVAATTATEYTDTSAEPGVAYTYRVAAANAAGAGAPGSVRVTATRPVATPTGVSASFGTYTDKVIVSWKASEGASFYRVWRADSLDGEKTALGAWQTALSFEDTTAVAGTVYYYSVQAAVDETGTAASAFGGPAVGLRKISPKPVALTILGPDRVAAESTVAYTAKVRYENGAVASVVPVWSIASGGGFATIGADGLLTVGKLEEDRTIVLSARFIDGTSIEGTLEVTLVAPIVKTASVSDVEAHARWPWNGWVDVDYTLETAPTGTVAKVTLSGYDLDHKSALVATTLAGDGARGGTVAAGRRRISWNLGVDHPGFHTSHMNVLLNAMPSEPVVPPEPPKHQGLSISYYDADASALESFGDLAPSYERLMESLAERTPTLSTNTLDVGENLDFGYHWDGDGTTRFQGKYAEYSTHYFLLFMQGMIDVDETGNYKFGQESDDYCFIYIDGKTVVTNHGLNYSEGEVYLERGVHQIAIFFGEWNGPQGLKIYWQPPSVSNPTLLPQSVLSCNEEDGGSVNPAPPVATGDLYVSASSGNDSNDGRSWATAKKSIQAAIDVSSEGGTILVTDGTYAPITTDNKAITIRSENGAEKTVINGAGVNRCATLTSNQEGSGDDEPTEEETATVVIGFSFQNGHAAQNGGDVLGGTLNDCVIQNGYASAGGGCAYSMLNRCIVKDNFAEDDGGGLFHCIVYNSLITGNTADNMGGTRGKAGAGAVSSTLYNCTITANVSVPDFDDSWSPGGPAAVDNKSQAYNCIIFGNTFSDGSTTYNGYSADVDVGTTWGSTIYNCCTNNPNFVDGAKGDYRLAAGSPCIDSGNNEYIDSIETDRDLAGNARVANGTVDIGCYEYGSSPASSSLADGLVAYWPFDGDARDASGNGNDGTVNGARLTSDRNGKANGAYYFDGNDTIEVADNELLRSVTNEFTIATWVKYDQLAGDNQFLPIACKGTETMGRQFGLVLSQIFQDADLGIDQYTSISGFPQKGEWVHLAATFDRSLVATVYLNGQVLGSEQNSLPLSGNTQNLLIGADPHGVTEWLYGSLDDLGLWNRALTAKEVARLYAGEKPLVQTKYLVVDLSGGPSAASWPVEYMDGEPAGGFNTDEYKTTKLVLRRIEPGTFMMGGSYQTTLTKPYYMGVFEVTQKQYKLVTGENPSCFSGDKRPVEQAPWNTIRGNTNWPISSIVSMDSFMGRLRARTGLAFDLPTEAQWEYACRAGTTTAYSYGDNENGDYMWDSSNSSSQTHDVGTKQPNPWGLYDMHGNVWEWCLDWYASSLSGGTDPKGASSGTKRVHRGGSWYNDGEGVCSSSSRSSFTPLSAHYNFGFRLSCPSGL